MNLSEILPPRLRFGLYILFALVGLALGAIKVWCDNAQLGVPAWHTPALAVLGYLSAAFGIVAAANVPLRAAAVIDGVPQITTLGLDEDQVTSLRQLQAALTQDLGGDDPTAVALAVVLEATLPPARRHGD